MAIKPKKKSKGIVSWPKTERPREKLLHSGPETLSDGELVAVLLRIGKAGQSAEDLGRHLLAKFKGISGIDRAHIEELLAIPRMRPIMPLARQNCASSSFGKL